MKTTMVWDYDEETFKRMVLIEKALNNYGKCEDLLKKLIINTAIHGKSQECLIFMRTKYKITVEIEKEG